ncbi:hypothetical protein ZHAS_00019921 [Anopheles sinensis]|uniref:Uncharacterized protein n=1 Tax=Anopheles sinensis TaxID=74873 RepID=A0A084WMB8_ANOSI|nr:hypothetical protein ZHAS_00019921 [Anopheles sinensis]
MPPERRCPHSGEMEILPKFRLRLESTRRECKRLSFGLTSAGSQLDGGKADATRQPTSASADSESSISV